jgi:tRNA G18 (ribose-2'-O)-methylase SpoU
MKLSFLSPEDFFASIDPEYQLVAIETSEDSGNLYSAKLPEKIIILVGNERNGLPAEILERCELKVHIPMTGKCKSMNVSHALAVALFEWQRQMLFPLTSK